MGTNWEENVKNFVKFIWKSEKIITHIQEIKLEVRWEGVNSVLKTIIS